MTKSELIACVAEKTGSPKAVAERFINATLEGIGDSLERGEGVILSGFGSFSITERAARQGRNPRTGATLQIAASKGVHFKPAKGLKDALN